MARGPAPTWRQKAPHTVEAEPYINAASPHGFEKPFTWGGIVGKARAVSCRRGLFNAARNAGVSVSADIEPGKVSGEWKIVFTLHDKATGRAHIVKKHGTDRASWPYDTRRKGGS